MVQNKEIGVTYFWTFQAICESWPLDQGNTYKSRETCQKHTAHENTNDNKVSQL